MNLLLRALHLEGLDSALGTRALGMVEAALRAMAKGGIYDHVFDGFARLVGLCGVGSLVSGSI